MVASSVDPWWCVNSPYFLNYFNVIMFVFVIKKFKNTFVFNLWAKFGVPLGRLPGAASSLPQCSCLGKYFFVWVLTATLKWNKISRRHPPRGPGGPLGHGGWSARKWPSVGVSVGRMARTSGLLRPSGWPVWRAPTSYPARATGQARLAGWEGPGREKPALRGRKSDAT